MPDYRCPIHDVIFQAVVDTRAPGAQADKVRKLEQHPNVHGHPECPQCNEAFKAEPAPKGKRGGD